MGATRGVSAFALAMRDKEYIRDFVDYVQSYGYTCLRVGAQTDGWRPFGKPWLPAGPDIYTPEWRKNLETLLEVTALRKNTWVQLIPTFTHKQLGGFQYLHTLCSRVVDIVMAGGYKHVFWEVMNEFKHPLTWDTLGDTDIHDLGRMIKDRTGQPVSSDHAGKLSQIDGTQVWKGYYPNAWQEFDYYAFHPPRNPGATSEEFKQAVARWHPKYVLFDETVCYASAKQVKDYDLQGHGTIALYGRGTEDDRKQVIRDEKAKVKASGWHGKWFYHSIWGIECKGALGTPDTWIPEY